MNLNFTFLLLLAFLLGFFVGLFHLVPRYEVRRLFGIGRGSGMIDGHNIPGPGYAPFMHMEFAIRRVLGMPLKLPPPYPKSLAEYSLNQ